MKLLERIVDSMQYGIWTVENIQGKLTMSNEEIVIHTNAKPLTETFGSSHVGVRQGLLFNERLFKILLGMHLQSFCSL